MAAVRCPECSRIFRVEADEDEWFTCPSCGHRGRLAEKFPVGEDEAPIVRDAFEPRRDIVGRARKTGKVVGYTILTLGVYRAVFRYKVFRELDRQHNVRHHYLLHMAGVSLLALLLLVGTGIGVGYATDYFGANKHNPFDDLKLVFQVFLGILGAAVVLLPFILSFAYNAKELRRLQAYRIAAGLKPGIGSGGYYAWTILGFPFLFIGPIVAAALINKSARQLWRKLYEQRRKEFPWNA